MEYFTQWNPLYDGDETEDDFNFNFINEDYNLWAEFEDELSESTAESSSSSKPRHNYFGSEDSFSDQDPVDEIISEDIATENIVEEPVISGSQNNGSIFKEEEEEIPIMIDYYQNTSSLEGHSRNNTEEIVMTESSSSSLIVKRNLLHATSGKITEFEQDILQPYKRLLNDEQRNVSGNRDECTELSQSRKCFQLCKHVQIKQCKSKRRISVFGNVSTRKASKSQEFKKSGKEQTKAKVKECIKCLLENFTRKKLPRRNTHPLQKKVCQSSFVNSDKDVQENGRALGTAGAVPLFSESTKEKNLFVEKSTEGSLCYNIHTLTDEGYSFEQITEWLEVYMDVPEHTVSKTLAFDVQQGFQLSWGVLGINRNMIEKVRETVMLENQKDVQNVQLLMKLLPTNFVTMDQLYVVLGILVYEHGIVKTSDTDAGLVLFGNCLSLSTAKKAVRKRHRRKPVKLSKKDFYRRFQFSKSHAKKLFQRIAKRLKPGKEGHALKAEEKFYIALEFYTTNKTYAELNESHGAAVNVGEIMDGVSKAIIDSHANCSDKIKSLTVKAKKTFEQARDNRFKCLQIPRFKKRERMILIRNACTLLHYYYYKEI